MRWKPTSTEKNAATGGETDTRGGGESEQKGLVSGHRREGNESGGGVNDGEEKCGSEEWDDEDECVYVTPKQVCV